MKDKLKTPFGGGINTSFVHGIVIGGVVGSAVTLASLIAHRANFTDPETTLHIPDSIVRSILETGLPVMTTRHDGVQLMIGPS
jgi:hypothetical protein